MPFDSSTLCARTSAGDAELATPSQGLSLGQRRVLSLLQHPSAVEELGLKNHLEPEKLARDLTRLAELRLVLLQGPALTVPPHPAPVASDLRSQTPDGPGVVPAMTPVVLGHGPRRMLPLAAPAAALVLAAGVWYGLRSKDPVSANPAPPVVQTAPSPAPAGAATTKIASNAINAVPAVATVLRGNVVMPAIRPEIRPDIRPGAASVPASPAKPNGTPAAAEPKPAAPAVAGGSTVPAPILAPPSVASSAAPTAASTAAPVAMAPLPVAPTAGVQTPPSMQLAAAAPSAVAPLPLAAAALKSIYREAPDFPKEAVADGLNSGIVNARIHVDARGNVASVDILGSQPPKVFDRAARKALTRWQFEPLAAGQTAELDVDVKFQRE